MRYDRSDSFIAQAVEVVKEYDPETFRRMMATDFTVSTDMDEAFPEIRKAISTFEWATEKRNMLDDGAMGVTISGETPIKNRPWIRQQTIRVWMGKPQIHRFAHERGTHPLAAAASVLVHEFHHVEHPELDPGNESEIPAYYAGMKFGEKLPPEYGRAIVDHQGRQYEARQKDERMLRQFPPELARLLGLAA